MGRWVIYILIVFFFAAESHAQKKDLRNVSWGMTRLEVMANEDIAPESFELMYLYYQPEIEGRKFNLIYEFIDNRLTDAEYIFTAYNRNDYLWIKGLVETKYGRPFYASDGGVGNYEFKWKNPGTEIVLRPGRDRECLVVYSSKKFRYLKTEKAKEMKISKIKDVKKSF